MTQFATARYHQYSLPGATVTLGQTESIYARRTAQTLTFTFGGAPDPLVADETFTMTFPAPNGQGSIVVSYDATAGQTLAQVAAGFNTAWGVSPEAAALYTSTNAGAVNTLVAKSGNLSIAAASFDDAQTPATHTITVAQTQASGGTALRMGLLYVLDTTAPLGPAVSSTGRRAWAARAPVVGDAITALRGVVAREVNSTTLSADFNETLAFDAYPVGQIGYGQLTEEVVAVVDPNSAGVMDVGSQVHWVTEAGTFTTPGAVASAAAGVGTTIRLDNTNPVRARVVRREETVTMGAGTGAQSVRLVTLEVWRAC